MKGEGTLLVEGKKDTRYWYSIADMFQIMQSYRIENFNDGKQSYRNTKKVLLCDPISISQASEYIINLVNDYYQEYNEYPKSVIVPVLTTRVHWMVIRLWFRLPQDDEVEAHLYTAPARKLLLQGIKEVAGKTKGIRSGGEMIKLTGSKRKNDTDSILDATPEIGLESSKETLPVLAPGQDTMVISGEERDDMLNTTEGTNNAGENPGKMILPKIKLPIDVLFDDPFGIQDENSILNSYTGKVLIDALAESFEVSDYFVKALIQQNNSWDCGPIAAQNAEDYIRLCDRSNAEICSNESEFYTLKAITGFPDFVDCCMTALRHKQLELVEKYNPITDPDAFKPLLLFVKEDKEQRTKDLIGTFQCGTDLQEEIDSLSDFENIEFYILLDTLKNSQSELKAQTTSSSSSSSSTVRSNDDYAREALKILKSDSYPIPIPLNALSLDTIKEQVHLTRAAKSSKRLNFDNTDDFKFYIQENRYFVDKTWMINDLLSAMAHQTSVISRPRKFGKSLNLSMLYYFFNVEVEENGMPAAHNSMREYFSCRLINESKESMALQGRIPVIKFNLKFKARTKNDLILQLGATIKELFKRDFSYIKDSLTDPDDQKIFADLASGKADEVTLIASISYLLDFIEIHYKKKKIDLPHNPIVLVDEFDSILNDLTFLDKSAPAVVEECEEVLDFMGEFFGMFKSCTANMFRLVLTGIVSFRKYPGASGFNNATFYSIIDDNLYYPYFGFTEDEVNRILADAKITDSHVMKVIKTFYYGYQLMGKLLFTPHSIKEFVTKFEYGAFWTTQGSSERYLRLVKSPEIVSLILELMNSFKVHSLSPVTSSYDVALSYSLFDVNKVSIFTTYFANIGYLALHTEGGTSCGIRIPNLEVYNLFKTQISECLQLNVPDEVTLNSLEVAFQKLTVDLENFSKFSTDVLNLLQSFATGRFTPNESIFHSIYQVIGLLKDDRFVISSETKEGTGKGDTVFTPLLKGSQFMSNTFIVQEYKFFPARYNKESVRTETETALWQILLRQYMSQAFDLNKKYNYKINRIILRGVVAYVGPNNRPGTDFEEIDLNLEQATTIFTQFKTQMGDHRFTKTETLHKFISECIKLHPEGITNLLKSILDQEQPLLLPDLSSGKKTTATTSSQLSRKKQRDSKR
jgi:hypothetical protein